MIKTILFCSLAIVVNGQIRPLTFTTPGRQATVLTVSNAGIQPGLRPIGIQPQFNPLLPEDLTPKPYAFAYEAVDDLTGSNSKREESSDGRTTRGSYSYIDADGVFRVVEYTADENGFNANIRTNEPGTAPGTAEQPNPANTAWAVEPPPPAVAARYATAEAALAARSGLGARGIIVSTSPFRSGAAAAARSARS